MRKLRQGARAFIGNDLKVIGFTTNDATQRDRAIEWLLAGSAWSSAIAMAIGISSAPGTATISTKAPALPNARCAPSLNIPAMFS